MSDDRKRPLGVIEAISAVRDQCPSGAVQTVATHALETIKREGAAAFPQQAFLVLTAIRGWSGDRALQVKQSLRAFLAESESSSRE